MSAGTWFVFKKEIIDLYRDRKTWLATVILPLVLIPGLMLLLFQVMSGSAEEARAHVPLAAVGGIPAELAERIESKAGVAWVDVADPEAALEDGEIRAYIEAERKLEERLAAGETGRVTVYFDPMNEKSMIAHGLLETALNEWKDDIVAARLAEAGLPAETADPLAVHEEAVTSPARASGTLLGFFVPLLLVMSCVTGGLPAATDLIAGEKERGTLEPLISTPVRRESILFAKLMAVSLMGVISALASLVSLLIVFQFLPDDVAGELNFSFLTPQIVTFSFIVLFLMALMFAPVSLTLSTVAKSFKEAQTYVSPLVIIAMVPAYIAMPLTPDDIPEYYFLIPVMNAIVLLKELLYGLFVPAHVGLVLGSTVLFIGIAVFIMARMFNKERFTLKA